MQASHSFRVRTVHACREAIRLCLALIGLAAFFVAASTSAQDRVGVVSIDHFRTDRVTGESRHEILPVAVFDGRRFLTVSEWEKDFEGRSRRRDLLAAYPLVQVLNHGRRIGMLEVSNVHRQKFHCNGLIVGSGEFEPDGPQPINEIADFVQAGSDSESSDYTSQSFIGLSGAVDQVGANGDPLVVTVTDPSEIERLAMDVLRVAPRSDLPPLAQDETRAYRLERYDAVVVVRKRRSSEMLPFPVDGVELKSPLMTDVVAVRIVRGERIVHPLWISGAGTDSWGKGPQDYFIDAFELGDGMAYLAFRRRDYEAVRLRLYRLPRRGAPALVFEDDLYGC